MDAAFSVNCNTLLVQCYVYSCSSKHIEHNIVVGQEKPDVSLVFENVKNPTNLIYCVELLYTLRANEPGKRYFQPIQSCIRISEIYTDFTAAQERDINDNGFLVCDFLLTQFDFIGSFMIRPKM